jgi:hypothetical protein
VLAWQKAALHFGGLPDKNLIIFQEIIFYIQEFTQ